MKIIKFQIPRAFLLEMGHQELFEHVEFLEIIKAYQYDAQNFFSMQRIVFRSGVIEKFTRPELEQYIKKKFFAHHLEINELSGRSMLVIMKQKLKTGWIPFENGPWAFLFPILVSPTDVFITYIIQDEFVDEVKTQLEKFTHGIGGYHVLAQTSVNPKTQTGLNSMPVPNITDRQREIGTYATRHGFFHSPKRITAKEIGNHFQISESAVNHNLRRIQHSLMQYFFGEDTK
ncbi:MAG: helix-turn-helix domain-containing protein [Candidatus Heimdallarchaeota archaeon]|nr:helix-turn-helix domain-containing protein [Candidatus Heimdallarchaeota archaeon]